MVQYLKYILILFVGFVAKALLTNATKHRLLSSVSLKEPNI